MAWLPVVFMVFMVISGFYGFHGYQWFSMVTSGFHGYQWFSMVTSGFYGFHGYQWFSMVLGFFMVLMVTSGFLWLPVVQFYGYHGYTMQWFLWLSWLGSGHAATIELSPRQKLVRTNQIRALRTEMSLRFQTKIFVKFVIASYKKESN